MGKRKCPGCGAYFFGKRCPECYYTIFETDMVPSFHRDDRPAERPQSRERRAVPSFRAGKLLLIAWVVFFTVMMVGTLIGIFSNIRATSFMEMEAIALPEGGQTLYDADGIQLILGWNGGEITGDIPVYLVNGTDRDIYACTEGVAVNGCMAEDVFFYCEAGKNTTSMSQLWIDTAYLQSLGILSVQEITLQLSIVDDKDYIQLNASEDYHTFGPGDSGEAPRVSGQLLYQSENVSLVYQGAGRDAYGGWQLRFFLQNHRSEVMDVFCSELYINGEETSQYLYQKLFPNTWAVLDWDIYHAEPLQLEDPKDIRTLEFDLNISRYGDTYAQEMVPVSVTID